MSVAAVAVHMQIKDCTASYQLLLLLELDPGRAALARYLPTDHRIDLLVSGNGSQSIVPEDEETRRDGGSEEAPRRLSAEPYTCERAK